MDNLRTWRRLSRRQREVLAALPRGRGDYPYYITTARALAARGLLYRGQLTPRGVELIAWAKATGFIARRPDGTWQVSASPLPLRGPALRVVIRDLAGHGLSVTRIAAEVGVSRQTVYNHLPRTE